MSSFTMFYYGGYENNNVAELLMTIFSVAIVLFFVFVLIAKTDQVIDFFKLDVRHDAAQVATNQVSGTTLFQAALVFIGLSLIVNSTVDFIAQLYYAIEYYIPNKRPPLDRNFNVGNLYYTGISIVFGLFLTLNAFKLAAWFDKKQTN